MDIKSLEINLLKASQVKDGDVILVKIDEDQKKKLQQEDVTTLYNEIKNMIKKDISIYFFPKNLSIDTIKKHVKNIEDNKEEIIEKEKNK